MNSKDRFDAEKWDSIDEVNTSVVPQYEFEDAENNNQSNSFVAEKWFVEEEDKIEPTVKKKESENNSVQNGSTINQKSENNSVSKLQATSNKKGKLVKILVAAVLIIVIIGGLGYFAFSDSLRLTEYIEPTYWEGKCGDNATFSIYDDSNNSTPHYVLLIEGKGALWKAEDIDWEINEAKIKEIVVYEGITKVQEDQFSTNYVFDNVTKIDFRGSVSYIGKNACANIDSLEIVNVDNENCKIDYDDERYIYNTLGNTEGGITILCYEGSTAEDYVETWNSNYSNSYKLKFY